jgi:hypothetical protein
MSTSSSHGPGPTASGPPAVETSGVIPALPGSADEAGSGAADRGLFTALVDDAAVFPPGLAPMAEAVPAHRRHTAAWYADVVGPFLVPAGATEAFRNAMAVPRERETAPAGGPVRVAVVADPSAGDPLTGALDALAAVSAVPGTEVVAVEVPLPPGSDQAAAAADLLARLRSGLPDGVRAWVEVRRAPGWREALGRLADAGDEVGAKFRTGGTTASAFPSSDELAAFVRAAVDADVVFKLTAGLHSAVRGPDAPTGGVHHGVLNVVCAVRAALNGAEAHEVAEVLEVTAPQRLASAVRRMSGADVSVLRAFFASFGCCGVTDPVGDLVGLGLLEEVPA